MALYIDPTQNGVKADGVTDDTAAWQSLINTAPNGSCILIPPTMCSVISNTIKVYSKCGITFRNLGAVDTLPQGRRGAEFAWKGNQPGVVSAFDVNWGRRIVFDGISLSCDFPGTIAPTIGIRFDEWNDTTPGLPKRTNTNTTACRVLNCLFTPPAAATGTIGTFHALDFSLVSQQNVDLMTIAYNIFQGNGANWGEGIRVGSSSNAKGYEFHKNNIGQATVGIHMIAGSAKISMNTFESCALDIQNEGTVDFFVVEECNSEFAGMALSIGGSSCTPIIRGNRWSSMTGTAAMWLRVQPGLILESNNFQGAWNNGVRFTAPFQLPPTGQSPQTGMKLYTSGNRFYQMTDAIFRQFGYHSIGMEDVEY